MTQRRGLNKQVVIDMATTIVDTEGAAALTLSRVAHALEVKPPSLYSHVESLDTLRRDVALSAVKDLGTRLGTVAMGRSGRDALRAVAVELRTYAASHPGLYELSAQARPDDQEYAAHSMGPVEPVLAILRGYDLEHEEAIHAARTLRAALHGFAELERIGGFGLEVDVDQTFEWLIDNLADMLESASPPAGA